MTNGFALNHYKSLQIYFFCVKCQAKNDFLKDVKSTVSISEANILSKFYKDWVKTVTSRVLRNLLFMMDNGL